MTRPPDTPMLRVRGLKKSYGKLSVLRGVEFEVARGSIFALLGPNGARKTTVVRTLSTLLKADAGTATIAGFDVASQPARVRESVSLTGQFAAVADDLLDRFALADAGGRKVAAYSGGMRRQLDIAMSLIGNPPVVFLALVGGDGAHRTGEDERTSSGER